MNIGSGLSIKTYAKYVQDKVKEIQKETGKSDLVLTSNRFLYHLHSGSKTGPIVSNPRQAVALG